MDTENTCRMNDAKIQISAESRTAVLLILLLLAALCPLSGLQGSAAADSSELVTIELDGTFNVESSRQMLDLINDLRANDAWYWNSSDTEKVYLSDLVPLEYDYALERAAMQRAAELAVYYDHYRPDGTICYTAYPDGFMAMGENIAIGQTSVTEVFTAWAEANEPYSGQGHRRNMLESNFTAVGIGCFSYNGILCWVQEFGNPKTSAASNPLTAPVSIDVLKSRITQSTLGGNIIIMNGSTVNLPEFHVYIADSFLSDSGLRFSLSEENCTIDDTSIASISDGKIVGNNLGETTLHVTYCGLTASASISVVEDTTMPLSLDTPVNVTISEGETVYFSFIPSETQSYIFYSSGSRDTIGYLYNSDREIITDNDDDGEDYNFAIFCDLIADTQYYFGVRFYSADETGTVTVTLIKDPAIYSDGFAYRLLDDGTASIIGCYLSGDVVIPEKLDGYTVTNLAAQLFYGVSGVTSVTIPATVTYFGTQQDNNDWDYVFSYCYYLENIFVDSENPVFKSVDGVLYSKDGNTLINYPCNHRGEVYHVNARTLCCTSFASCRNLKYLFLDNQNTSWYTFTFYNTSGLTVFYKEGGATEQQAAADRISDCSFVSMENIAHLPNDLKRIESQAFEGTGIRYLYIPDSCTRIESGAFTGSMLEYVSVGGSTYVEAGAFDSTVIVETR